MKKIMSLFVITLITLTATTKAQNLDKFFNKYAKDNNFQYSVIDNSQSDLAKNKGVKGVSKLLKKVEGVKVLTLNVTDDNAPLANKFTRDVYYTFNTTKFETIASNEDENSNVKILRRELKEGLTDIIVITKEGKQINLIWLKGEANEG